MSVAVRASSRSPPESSARASFSASPLVRLRPAARSPPVAPILIATHVTFAVGLVAPSLLLPFAVRAFGAPAAESGNRLVRLLVTLERRGTLTLGACVAITGAALLVVLGLELTAQPWLLVALIMYCVVLVVAYFVQRPGLRALIGRRGARDDETWQRRARRQRYVSYALASLVGAIGILMSAKPRLW